MAEFTISKKDLTVIDVMREHHYTEPEARAYICGVNDSGASKLYEALRVGIEGIKLNPKGEERELAIRAFLFLAEKALALANGNGEIK